MSAVTKAVHWVEDRYFDAHMYRQGCTAKSVQAQTRTPESDGFEQQDIDREIELFELEELWALDAADETHRGQMYALMTKYIEHCEGVGERAGELAAELAELYSMSPEATVWFISRCIQGGFGHDRIEETLLEGKTKDRHGVESPEQLDCYQLFVKEGRHLVDVVSISAVTNQPGQTREGFMDQIANRERSLVCHSRRDRMLARWLARKVPPKELGSIRHYSDLVVIAVKTADFEQNADPAKGRLVLEQDRAFEMLKEIKRQVAEGKKLVLDSGDDPDKQIRYADVSARAAENHRARILKSGTEKYAVYYAELAAFAFRRLGCRWKPLEDMAEEFGLGSPEARQHAIDMTRPLDLALEPVQLLPGQASPASRFDHVKPVGPTMSL